MTYRLINIFICLLLDDSRNFLFSTTNGTLFFDKLQADDEGEYVCEVANNVGEGLRKSISISVLGKEKSSYFIFF